MRVSRFRGLILLTFDNVLTCDNASCMRLYLAKCARLRLGVSAGTVSLLIDSPESFVQLSQMPAPPRKRLLGAQQRLALQLLADTPFGATEATMFVNGFKRQTLVRLIRAGLATTQREIKPGGQTIGRIRITEAGRRALEGY
jgi:hypothetical protein